MTTELRLNYTNKDYDAIVTDLKSMIPKINPEWTDLLETDLGWAIIRLQAALTDLNNYQLDRQAAEVYLDSCANRSSAISIAKPLGYKPRLVSSAVTQASITLVAPYNFDILIPQGFQCSIVGFPYFVRDSFVLVSGMISTTLSLKQGRPYTNKLVASGVQWYKVNLPLNITDITVSVDEVIWSEVDSFIYTLSPTVYKMSEDAGMKQLQFGGGLTASVPSKNAIITVTGVLSDGAAGNIFQSTASVTLADTLKDERGKRVNELLSATTLGPALGGSDLETLSEIKVNAPAYYTTQNRAVTEDDYTSIVRTIPGVAGVKVWGGDKVNRYGEVFVCIYTLGMQGGTLSKVPQSLIDEVQRILDQKRVIPIKVNVVAPTPLLIYFSVDVYISQFVDSALATSNVVSSINSMYKVYDIGLMLQKSDMIRSISSDYASTIDYLNISLSCGIEAQIIDQVLQINLPEYTDLSSVVIWKKGYNSTQYDLEIYTTKSGSTHTIISNSLYISFPLYDSLVTTDVLLKFNSLFDDIYPSRDQMIMIGGISVAPHKSGSPV